MIELVIKCDKCSLEGLREPYRVRANSMRELHRRLIGQGWLMTQAGVSRKIRIYCKKCRRKR